MNRATREGLGLVGVGAVACAACCAGPVLGFLAAIGVGTLLGVAAFGFFGLLVAVPLAAALLRRRRARSCADPGSIAVPSPTRRPVA